MINKNAPQELGKELVESSAVAGAVKREADAFKCGSFTKVKILKEIKGTWHTLQPNQVYELPYLIQCKKTKRRLIIEVVESERCEAGFFVSFCSESNSEKNSYAGCGFALKLHEDFEILENTSACINIPSASTGTQINLFEND